MSPKQTPQQACSHQDYPTSPWTEAYQPAFNRGMEEPDRSMMTQESFDGEDQQPTRDALSSIYNWGY